MHEAVQAHVGHRRAWYSALVGPFLCPASALDELASQIGTGSEPFGVSVVVDTGVGGVGTAVDAVASDDRMVLRGVEVPLRGEPASESARRTVAALDAALGGPDDDEPAYVEIPRVPGWPDALAAVADSGYRAKLRTGGVTAEAFPPEDDVAAFILACLELDVPFKFTAGLHHAVRHTDPATGFEHHGFLNVLLAVAALTDGAPAGTAAEHLRDTDADRVAAALRTWSPERAARARAVFTSFGTCSVLEPVDDLVRLSLLPSPERIPA
jgi:hypothetical protein